MERVFQIAAVILAGIAAYFLWQRNGDGAFVTAVLGAVAFFLSVRFQVKSRLSEREIERLENEERERKFLSEPAENFGAIKTDEFVSTENEKRTKDRVL